MLKVAKYILVAAHGFVAAMMVDVGFIGCDWRGGKLLALVGVALCIANARILWVVFGKCDHSTSQDQWLES